MLLLANAAPSTHPPQFQCSSLEPQNITLVWGEVDIRGQNGPILGYRVRLHGSSPNPKLYVIDRESRKLTVPVDQHPRKIYAFSIAAYNRAGVGPFSPVLFVAARA